MIESKKHLHCPLCGHEQFTKLITYQSAHLVKCRNCRLTYSIKIPSEKELSEHYATYNRGKSISPLTLKRYNQLLTEFSVYRKTNKVLDVGCGSGFFLDVAKELNWDVYGTEYGDEAVEFCKAKGLNVLEGPIEKINLEPASFDIITSFEVIEHLSNPLEHFEALHKLLRPGGLLYVTTPNFNAITRNVLKSDWNVITFPEHLTYFTARTLNHGLKSIGFKRKKIITHGISVDRLRNSFQKRKTIPKKSSGNVSPMNKPVVTNESIRHATENNSLFRLLRKTVDSGLNTTRKGEFLKGYFIKPE